MGTLRMKKVEIIGERERMDIILKKLQELSILHIEDSPLNIENKEQVKPAINEKEKEVLRDVEKSLDMIEEIKKEIFVSFEGYEKVNFKNVDEVLKKVSDIYFEYQKLKEEERVLREEISVYHSFNKILEVFETLIESKEIEIPEDFEIFGALLPRDELLVLTRIEKSLKEEYGEKLRIFYRVIKGSQIAVLIAFSPSISKDVRERLWKEGLPELKLPQEMEKLPLKEMLKFLRQKFVEIPEKLKDIENKKREFLNNNLNFLFNAYFLLQDIRDYLKVKEKGIFVTRHFFYLEGFVPEKEIDNLRNLTKEIDGIYLKELKPEKEEYERIPVVLKNPSFFKNFEPLIEFFSLPVYQSFDPTPLLALFFPVYFGFMLGDMGYGFLGALLFMYLYVKFKKNDFVRKISFVFLLASISSIIFGFIYMEMFGDVLEKLGFHPIFHRVHEANTYLLIAVIFGTIQVILGLLLGIYNALKLGHKKHAIGVLSMLLGLICVLLLAGTSLGVLPSSFTIVFLLLLFVFMVMSFIFHGPAAPIEIFSAFGHILSFARLMAIGLSSAIIAVIANKFLSILPSIVIGVFVMLLFHILAFVLGLFDPTIQGLRLQFVEFFTKFYEAGGREYKPLFKRLKGVRLPEIT